MESSRHLAAPGPATGCHAFSLIRARKVCEWGVRAWVWSCHPSLLFGFVLLGPRQAAQAENALELLMDEHVKSFATLPLPCFS